MLMLAGSLPFNNAIREAKVAHKSLSFALIDF